MLMNIWRSVQLLLLFLIVVSNSQSDNGCESPDLKNKKAPSLFELSIIHMNDFHARFEEINEKGWPCQRPIDKNCFGGLPRTLTAARELKNQQPNSIFLNAGDHYQGTIWYNIFKWNATAKFLNMLPHDVMTIGNHDFDGDIEGLVPFLQHVNVPVVLSNIIMTSEPILQNLIKKSHIIERGGRKIGVIGVIFQTVWEKSKVGNTWFLKEIESINSEAQNLKEQGVDIIIVLSHCGINIDRHIAANCPDVDIIVGGHSHTFLYSGTTSPPYDTPKDEYPVVVTQSDTKRTVLIVQAFAFTKYLGHLSVLFNENGEIEDWRGEPILLDETIPEDSAMLKSLEPYKKLVDAKYYKAIGETETLLLNNCRYRECNIGNMITDAMVASYIDRAEGNDWTYAAIAINYAGAIKKSINPGTITYGDLIMTLPFDDTWDVIEVQGRHIRQALEESFSSSVIHDHTRYYSSLMWSGIDIVYDTSGNALSRVVAVKVRCQKCSQPIYENLKDNKWYRIVVPGFMAHNGGQSTLADIHKNHVKGHGDIDQLIKFIGMINPLNYKKDHRIYFCDRFRQRNCGNNYRAFIPRQTIFPDSYINNMNMINLLDGEIYNGLENYRYYIDQ